MSSVSCYRFPLVIAAGGRRQLAGRPAALAPEPGRGQFIGEVSAAAEAHGVHPGMRLGEALARCRTLMLVPPDPVRVADHWETVLRRLASIGAAVESNAPGAAYFDAAPLARLYAHRAVGPASPAPLWLAGVVDACRAALRVPARIGAGPSRFCALVAATQARQRHPTPSTPMA
jgi:protein ImuB